jgi:hypothetical protein
MYDRMESVSRQLDFVGLEHHTYQEAMLARIGPVEPLRVLADAVETAGVDARRRAQKYSSLIPLNRMVDAVHPESEYVRQLELAVKRGDYAFVRATLTAWSMNQVNLEELVAISTNLAAAAKIGLEALTYLETSQPPTAEWSSHKIENLDAMAKPSAELSLAAIRPIKALVEAAVQLR